jgi:hypothetical protein
MVSPEPAEPPVNPPVTVGTDQEYNVPLGTTPFVPFTGEEINSTLLHVNAVILFIVGFGFTTIVTVNEEPLHPNPEVGVTVYVAV